MEENTTNEEPIEPAEGTEGTEPKKEKEGTTLKRMLLLLLILFFGGLGITLIFFYVYLPSKTNHGETITVPNLVEMTVDDLEEMVIKKGLRYEVNDSVYTSKYPPLTIVQQYPKANSKVKEGRKIFLSINRNTVPSVTLPQDLFIDKSLTHVKAVLNNLDIEVERILVRRGPDFNLVLEARYEGEPLEDGAQIPKGSSLVLVVADGYGTNKNIFHMPNFFGVPFDEADFARKGLDLNLEPLRIPAGLDTTDQELFVVRQSPDPETDLRLGENITFWVDTEIDSAYYFELFPPDSIAVSPVVIDSAGVESDSLRN